VGTRQALKFGEWHRTQDDDDSGKALEDGQIRVNVRACGLNFADIFAAMGLYSATPKGRFTPGLEFSGVVSEVHPSVASNKGSGGGSKLKVGDAVMGVTRFGGYTTVLNVGAAYVRPLPKGWSFSQGASFLCTTMTVGRLPLPSPFPPSPGDACIVQRNRFHRLHLRHHLQNRHGWVRDGD
jgi:NADPH:quinone reductase-like Zn-dependent oxidoreductase